MLLFKIAETLGVTVLELEEKLTYGEFLEWGAYFGIKFKEHEKIEYYLAQIAGYLSGQSRFKINDFLIKFGSSNIEKTTPAELAEILKQAFGVKK